MSGMGIPPAAPSYEMNIYTPEAILDPYPHYRRLRQLGPVVWLSRQRVYALPRYTESKAAMRDDATFRSAGGVALNPLSNRLSRGTTLASDGAEHERRRKLVAHRMLPRALGAINDQCGVVRWRWSTRRFAGVRSTALTSRPRCRWR